LTANIIIVFPRLDDAKNIKNMLARNGINATGVCSTGKQALAMADSLVTGIIITAYRLQDMPYFELMELMPPDFSLLLLASKQKVEEGIAPGVVAVPMPFTVADFIDTVYMLSEAAVYRKRKLKSLPPKRSKEDKKIIEEAKQLLMERNGLTEDDAHKYIQKCSMDSGTNMVESAKMVLSLF
jgi:response regulator NasT